MRKIGVSTSSWQKIYNGNDKKAIDLAAMSGADAIDFSLLHSSSGSKNDYRNSDSIYSKGDEAVIEYYTDLKNYAQEKGLLISQTHGRISGFKNIKEEDDALVENARLDCLATKVLGADVCVMHNPTTIHLGPDADPKFMQELGFNMFARILPYAKKYGVKIATETFGDAEKFNCVDFFGNIDEFMKLYNNIKNIDEYKDYFTTCVDTGHSNKAARFGNPSAADVIRRIGSDISVLHLNDNNTLKDQHKMPLSGSIDWKDVLKALKEVGYNGVYNMEMNLSFYGKELHLETATFAVKVMRNFLDEVYGKEE